MASPLNLMARHQWITEGSTFKFPPIEIKDEHGVLIPSPTTVELTWYDATRAPYAIINNLQGESVKSGRGRVSGGILTLTLTPADTVLLQPEHTTEWRTALIEYTWGSGGSKAGAVEIHCVVQNLRHRL